MKVKTTSFPFPHDSSTGSFFFSQVEESMSGLTCSCQALAEQLLGESVVAVNFQYFRKPPGGLATPPHQVSYVPIISNDEDMPIVSCHPVVGI